MMPSLHYKIMTHFLTGDLYTKIKNQNGRRFDDGVSLTILKIKDFHMAMFHCASKSIKVSAELNVSDSHIVSRSLLIYFDNPENAKFLIHSYEIVAKELYAAIL